MLCATYLLQSVTAPFNKALLISDTVRKEIFLLDVDHDVYFGNNVYNMETPVAVAVDEKMNRYYWVGSTSRWLVHFGLDGTGLKTVVIFDKRKTHGTFYLLQVCVICKNI